MAEHQETGCTHRWALGQPEVAGIQGVCRRCGARRTYPVGPIEVPELPLQDEAEPLLQSTSLGGEAALEVHILV